MGFIAKTALMAVFDFKYLELNRLSPFVQRGADLYCLAFAQDF